MDESNNMTATVDPLDSFRNSASVMGLSQDFSRFNAQPPSSYNSGGYNSANNNNRHVQWDDSEEEHPSVERLYRRCKSFVIDWNLARYDQTQ
jgi:hypothetical protein